MTAFKDEMALKPKATADVMVVREMLIPHSSIVSRTRSTGSFLKSVRENVSMRIIASSMPIPWWVAIDQ